MDQIIASDDRFLSFVFRFILIGIIVLAVSSTGAQSAAAIHKSVYFAHSADIGEQSPLAGGTKAGGFERYHLLPCEFLNSYAAVGVATLFSASPEHNEPIPAPTRAVGIDSICKTEEGNAKYHLETTISFDLAGVSVSQLPIREASSSDPILLSLGQSAQKSSFAAATSRDSLQGAREGFHWWPALQQSFNFLLIEHGFRIATDPFLRYLLWHKPFWHDWAASNQHFFFN